MSGAIDAIPADVGREAFCGYVRQVLDATRDATASASALSVRIPLCDYCRGMDVLGFPLVRALLVGGGPLMTLHPGCRTELLSRVQAAIADSVYRVGD